MFLFLAGHLHSVAFYFFRKKAPEQSHSQIVAGCRTLLNFYFFAGVAKKKKGAEQALGTLTRVTAPFA